MADPKYSVSESEVSSSWKMVTSHFLTRMGDKMWEFIIPIALIEVAPQTLLPAALFGVVVTLVRVIFGTSIGAQIDRRDRMTMIGWGIGGQWISVMVSSISLFFLLEMTTDPSVKEAMTTDIFYNWKSTVLTSVLLVSSAGGSLCANIMDIAVERDWVPTVIEDGKFLTITNTRMRQVDLLTEMAGPFLAGLIPLIPSIPLAYTFTIVAGFNLMTFFPQYLLLLNVYYHTASLRKKKSPARLPKTSIVQDFLCGEWNPIANIIRGWSCFIAQPVCLASIAFAFLWLTVLSPHDVVFTAYLNSQGYGALELSIFRGIGALVGFGGTMFFPFTVSLFRGIERASFVYIVEECIMVLCAAALFSISHWIEFDWFISTVLHYTFLVVLVLSRSGLYGFEVGEISIMQMGVPEEMRGIVNSVESSITSLSALMVFVVSTVLSDPHMFIYMVWGSAFFVTCGAFTYSLWFCCVFKRRSDDYEEIK